MTKDEPKHNPERDPKDEPKDNPSDECPGWPAVARELAPDYVPGAYTRNR